MHRIALTLSLLILSSAALSDGLGPVPGLQSGGAGNASRMTVVPNAGAPDGTLAKQLHTPIFPGPATVPSLTVTGPGSIGDVSAMSVRTPGGNVMLPLAARLGRRIDVRDFGAIFDGEPHPLSARFATLAAAQAVFPFVTSLSEEQDGVAIQAAINYCGTLGKGGIVDVPAGSGLTSRPIVNRFSQCSVRGPAENTEQLVNSDDNSANRYTTRLRAAPGFKGAMFRISPVEDTTSSDALTGSGITGVLLDCNRRVGSTGIVQKSTSFFETNVAVAECREEPVTVTAATAYQGTVLTVASTAGIPGLEYGASITHPSISQGTFVRSWTANTITVSSRTGARFTGSLNPDGVLTVTALEFGAIQAGAKLTGSGLPAGLAIEKRLGKTVDGVGTYQTNVTGQTAASTPITTTVAAGDTIGVAGEAMRIDTAQTKGTNTVSWAGISLQALSTVGRAPMLLVNGSAPATGSGQGYGNTAHVTFRRVVCYAQFAPCTVMGNSDHVAFEYTNFFPTNPDVYPDPNGIVSLGSDLPAGSNNGPAYSNRWGYVSGALPTIMRGTETYTYPTYNNVLTWMDNDNGTPLPAMGRDAIAYAAHDGRNPVAYDGGLEGVSAQIADGTRTRGNPRGNLATDLQKERGLASQVASGAYSVISGGVVNAASGYASVVAGGYGNSAQGRASVVSGEYGNALGLGWRCHSGGRIDFGSGQVDPSIRQHCDVPLMASSNANGPIRATGDGKAATGAGGENGNCVNIPDSTVYSLDIQFTAVNRSNANQRFSWREPNALLTRLSGPASTVYTPSGQASGVGVGGWSTSNVSVTAAADTSVGCLNLAFVPPAGNADFVSLGATVRVNWAQ